ncbi:NADH-quinone oxidoreductase subunit B, partial [Chloroflexota bacterium]
MEVSKDRKYIYSDTELDRAEGLVIEELKASSQEAIADPDEWLYEEIKRNVLFTTVDAVINWSRRSS